jgi:hypothetical protein
LPAFVPKPQAPKAQPRQKKKQGGLEDVVNGILNDIFGGNN